jgi:prevent-host-death family protein
MIDMKISVTEAEGQLTDLIRRAEAGEEVILVLQGRAAVRLMPIVSEATRNSPRALMESIGYLDSAKATPGPSAARSQDFLYNDDGLPK